MEAHKLLSNEGCGVHFSRQKADAREDGAGWPAVGRAGGLGLGSGECVGCEGTGFGGVGGSGVPMVVVVAILVMGALCLR